MSGVYQQDEVCCLVNSCPKKKTSSIHHWSWSVSVTPLKSFLTTAIELCLNSCTGSGNSKVVQFAHFKIYGRPSPNGHPLRQTPPVSEHLLMIPASAILTSHNRAPFFGRTVVLIPMVSSYGRFNCTFIFSRMKTSHHNRKRLVTSDFAVLIR